MALEIKERLAHWIGTVTRGDVAVRIEADPNDPADCRRATDTLALLLQSASASSTPPAFRPSPSANGDGGMSAVVAPGVLPALRVGARDSIAQWVALNGTVWAPKTQVELPAIANRFVAWLDARGVGTLADVARHHVADYKQHLLASGLSPRTVNKHLTTLNSLFVAEQRSGRLGERALPTSRQLFGKRAVAKTSRSWKPLTAEDLRAVFDPAPFLAWAKTPDKFWVALILLHQGMRVGEAAQLSIADFALVGTTQAVTVSDEMDGARVKTDASRRTIPVHPALLDLGLLQYLDDVRRVAGDGPLFPYLNPKSVNGLGDVPSASLNQYLAQQLSDPRKRSHSFRHTIVETLKQAGIPEEWRCEFVGHAHPTINSSVYASPMKVAQLGQRVLPALQFPLDYAALKYRRGMFDKVLVAQVKRRKRHEQHKATQVSRGTT